MPSLASLLWYLLLGLMFGLARGSNSTFYNPILPGFHPDPSCIFVPEWNHTFFCASSSFEAFPGIPIHASKDLKNWKLIGSVLNREEQLPQLAYANGSTSGIWAPTIRFHNGTFWVVTTLVFDDSRPANDSTRWNNIIFKSDNPFNSESWSIAVHFDFFGYDTSPFWDDDGKSYIVGSHYWKVYPSLDIAEANLDTGEVGEWRSVWNGTGGMAPEGPHLYRKDGWYYLLAAEGGTGLGHMVTMARSQGLMGPYESNPANPVLTAANTSNYFQTVGHADLFQDPSDNWWGVALSTRSGPAYVNYPMGRETVLTSVTWEEGQFPIWTPISGQESGWAQPPEDKTIPGPGPFISEGDNITFAPGTTLPAHFSHWRFPDPSSYAISPSDSTHPNTLRLLPSALNLTGLDGSSTGPRAHQTFLGRRQQDTLFTFRTTLTSYLPSEPGEEAGVTAFLTQNHHLDLGVVLLPEDESTTTLDAARRPTSNPTTAKRQATQRLIPQVRYRGISSTAVPGPVVAPVPEAWLGRPLVLEIRAANATHFSFSVGPADDESQLRTLLSVSNAALSYGFTGTFVGIYCTSNGGNGTSPAYFSDWRYVPQGQYIE